MTTTATANDEQARVLRFAKDLADPDWSLSVPRPAKDTIAKLVDIIEASPRTIHSIGAITAKEGMVVATAHGKVMVYINGHWQTPNSLAWWQPQVDWLPLTVLREGEGGE
ncbi:hypothetical protein [Arthrobacter sp. SAFR-014]|uniref:hypothetical protein n=1 Tax=unclassified Arthrobacter TaxID=235627 RepID=UPI003F7BB48A